MKLLFSPNYKRKVESHVYVVLRKRLIYNRIISYYHNFLQINRQIINLVTIFEQDAFLFECGPSSVSKTIGKSLYRVSVCSSRPPPPPPPFLRLSARVRKAELATQAYFWETNALLPSVPCIVQITLRNVLRFTSSRNGCLVMVSNPPRSLYYNSTVVLVNRFDFSFRASQGFNTRRDCVSRHYVILV